MINIPYEGSQLWKIRNKMFDDIEKATQMFHQNADFKIDRHQYDSCQCKSGMEATFCPVGHMLECHYPQTCDQAKCQHYQREVESE